MARVRILPERDRGLRILCVGAHADDIEIGCGGTLLTWLREHPGSTVWWAVCSGTGERREEAHAGAAHFLEQAAAREVIVESFPDGFFPDRWAAIKQFFERELKPFDPDVILTHYRDDRHQDHRVISELTWTTFRDHLILEYEIPKYDGDLGQPNFFVPLDRSVCRQKIDHLLTTFSSQKERSWFSEETFWAVLRLRGIEANASYAEAFYAHKVVGE